MNIDLPKLEISHRQAIGELRHVFFNAKSEEIQNETIIQITARISERLVTLRSGQRIIVTSRNKLERPSHVDGVLYNHNTVNKWLSHRLLDEYNEKAENGEWSNLCNDLADTWSDEFKYKIEKRDEEGNIIEKGLRPPQIGALHSIGAHWSLSDRLATIAMPTGTGKTETMISVLISMIGKNDKILVVVPNKALLEQTADKFLSLGLLRDLNVIPLEVKNPIIGIVRHRSKTSTDLEIFDKCHVIITTANAISSGTAVDQLEEVASKCTHLILDEAHHVPSNTWSVLRDSFKSKLILQFTATPWRVDGRPVDGKTVFNYPLGRAQDDGYFKSITYKPTLCTDRNEADSKIAETAIEQLESDLLDHRDHIIMARCRDIERAENVLKIYEKLGNRYNPVLIHNDTKNRDELINKIRSGESKILICVNMFGEGFDLPTLKIAAIHDSQKSVATLLQFIGRFTRTSSSHGIGDATVIANIADDTVSDAMKNLYCEDSNWNKLLSKISADAMRSHVELTEFLSNCKRLDEESEDDETATISPATIMPKLSALMFKCTNFVPSNFINVFEGSQAIIRAAWLNENNKVLFFITKNEIRVDWGRSRTLKDRSWDLYVIYFNADQQILYVHTSNNDLKISDLAKCISGQTSRAIYGANVFRSLGNIKRLMFQQVGLKKHGGRRNLRYSMYSGIDVREALSPAHTANSTKSVVSGNGYEGGRSVTIGCSHKGRIWSREKDTIQKFTAWCDRVGDKLNDDSIDTDKIIDNVLTPRPVGELPDKEILCIDWPVELIQKQEDKILLVSQEGEFPFSQYEIKLDSYDRSNNEISFKINHDTHHCIYKLKLTGRTDSEENPPNFSVESVTRSSFEIKFGNINMPLHDWFNDYPPEILFVDGDELMGCDLIELKEREITPMPMDSFNAWDWTGVDIRKESIWKHGEFRQNSIQNKVYEELISSSNFDIIFNDDSSGEAADLICLKEHSGYIQLNLIHCKFSGSASGGQRVKDVIEVCSQAIRSSRWIWRFKSLCSHITSREENLKISGASTRFLFGDKNKIKHLLAASRFKEIKTDIMIVQPGLQKSAITDDQMMVLTSAHSYLLDTVNIRLTVICNN